MEFIDWGAAQRVGELVAGSPPPGGVRAATVEPLAHDFARRVSAYSLLPEPAELPPLEIVDRSAWIAANLRSMRPMLAPVAERMNKETGTLAGPLRAVSGMVLGAQVGALTGLLSQRVLGQYDLALLDGSVPPRLLLLAPNLAQAARTLGVDRDELVVWVTIHEVTHAVQFSGAPWLREYLGGLLQELLDGLQVSLGGKGDADGGEHDGSTSGEAATEGSQAQGADVAPAGRDGGGGDGGSLLGGLRLPRLPDPAELREMITRAREGQLLRLTLGEDRWQLVQRMQAAMSLIEGHAEHTMDAVGEEVLPSLPRLRTAMTRRRETRGLPWRVLERLLGLELKLRQYETGRRFCDAVVAEGGTAALALAWRDPGSLPTAQELERPSEWLARVRGPAAELSAG